MRQESLFCAGSYSFHSRYHKVAQQSICQRGAIHHGVTFVARNIALFKSLLLSCFYTISFTVAAYSRFPALASAKIAMLTSILAL
jgi:hypothetical protein